MVKKKSKGKIKSFSLISEDIFIDSIPKWERCERVVADGKYAKCDYHDMCCVGTELVELDIELPYGLPLKKGCVYVYELPINTKTTGRCMLIKDIMACIYIDGYGYLDRRRVKALLEDLENVSLDNILMIRTKEGKIFRFEGGEI